MNENRRLNWDVISGACVAFIGDRFGSREWRLKRLAERVHVIY
jgi:hypothetical protein